MYGIPQQRQIRTAASPSPGQISSCPGDIEQVALVHVMPGLYLASDTRGYLPGAPAKPTGEAFRRWSSARTRTAAADSTSSFLCPCRRMRRPADALYWPLPWFVLRPRRTHGMLPGWQRRPVDQGPLNPTLQRTGRPGRLAMVKNVRGCSFSLTAPARARQVVPMRLAVSTSSDRTSRPCGFSFITRPAVGSRMSTGAGAGRE